MGIRTIEPFLNLLNVVKDAYVSMDVSIRKAVEDIEFQKKGLSKMGGSLGSCGTGNEFGDCGRDVWICAGEKNGNPRAVSQSRKDDIITRGVSPKGVLIFKPRGMNDLKVCEKCPKAYNVGKDREIKNCMEVGLIWSALVNNISQAFASQSKIGNKAFQRVDDAATGHACLTSHLGASASSFSYRNCTKKETNGEIVEKFTGSFVERNGKKDAFLDLSMGFLFDRFCQTIQQIQQNVAGSSKDIFAGYSNFVFYTSLAVKENRLFQNLQFARLGVPPNFGDEICAQDVKSDEMISGKEENTETASSRSLPDDVHNGPEYLRSTKSTISLSELKLEPQMEHPLQVSTGQKELLPQRDSLQYTKSEAPAKEQTDNVLKSALAGGFSCALSSFIMHPVDTVKTQVQASTLSLPEIISKIPQIGSQGLYRGIVPAVLGQFSSHGLRTGICETIKFILVNVAPTMPDLQVESVSSFCGTILGTTTRIPSEVLKQRLQAGLYENLGEAIVGTWKQDGFKAFFRGTGATLCREIPFYVAGMGLYTESKRVVQRLIGRQLEPWEIIVVGAISGGLAAVTTTPFDVIKTRMMVATGGSPESMSAIALSILQQEGPLGLFKGAVPRFFWVAPLGAMNFAGYELARKALG